MNFVSRKGEAGANSRSADLMRLPSQKHEELIFGFGHKSQFIPHLCLTIQVMWKSPPKT
ncbi:hypothetical protein LC653_26290 [Nostoc sp. CHAB 5784]|nr:hypothetical protein [Nostoc mirabile CHAB5784]